MYGENNTKNVTRVSMSRNYKCTAYIWTYELALYFGDRETGIVYGMFVERQMVRCGISSHTYMEGVY